MKKDRQAEPAQRDTKKGKNIIEGFNALREKSNFGEIMNRLKKIDMSMNRIHSKIKDEKIKSKFEIKDK